MPCSLIPAWLSFGGNTQNPPRDAGTSHAATPSHGTAQIPSPCNDNLTFQPTSSCSLMCFLSRDLHNSLPRRQGEEILFRNLLPGWAQLIGEEVALRGWATASPAQWQGSTLGTVNGFDLPVQPAIPRREIPGWKHGVARPGCFLPDTK